MPITNPAALPGAFLFFRITAAGGSTFAGVAYDENINEKTTLVELQKKYLLGAGANLPYMERFAEIKDGVNPWQGKNQVTYGEYLFPLLV